MAGESSGRPEGTRALILRLAAQEYLPLAGWLLIWVAVAAAFRPADVARLLAATLFTRAVREFTALDTGSGMRRRVTASAEVARRSLRLAVRVEVLSLIAGLLLLAFLVGALVLLDQERAAWLTGILAAALPARHFAPANRGRRRGGLYRLGAAWGGLALILVVIVVEGGIGWAAAALAAREWIALALVLFPAFRPRAAIEVSQREDVLRWREVAAITAGRARHRLNYRVTKGLLSIFGPIGTVIARTGRGVGAHRRLDRYVPQRRAPVALLGLGAGAAAIGALFAVREPATLILAAGLFRISGAATSAAAWAGYATGEPLDNDPDDDD